MKLLILALLTFGVWMLSLQVSYSWWNSSWEYRKQIFITENSGINLTNYPVNISENTLFLIANKKIRPDCSDIRIIDENMNLKLPFSLINCNSSATIITTKVNLTSFQTLDNIYMYYGNSNATKVSIPFNDAFYELWDDFNRPDFQEPDASKWVEHSWNGEGGDAYIYDNHLRIDTTGNWARRGIYSVKNFSLTQGWEVSIKHDWGLVYTRSYFLNSSRVFDYDISESFECYPCLHWRGGGHGIPAADFIKCDDNGQETSFGHYQMSGGWHTYKLILDCSNNKISSYYDGIYLGSTNYSNFTPSSLKFVTFASRNTYESAYFDDIFIRAYTTPEPTVTLGPEEMYQPFTVTVSTPNYIFFDEPFQLSATITYEDTPLTSLTQSNFQVWFDNEPLTASNFINHGNGSYTLMVKVSHHRLGTHSLTINITYGNASAEARSTTNLLLKPKNKVLIITNDNWKNYITAVSTTKPVLVYNKTKHFIEYFIDQYKPSQIFQLGTNLTLDGSFFIDTPETLIKLFFRNSTLLVPSNKKVALSACMLKKPILFNPSDELLEYLDPQEVIYLNSTEEVETVYLNSNPLPNYIILVNPEDIASMVACSLAIKKDAFIIQTEDVASQAKQTLEEKIGTIKPYLSSRYMFETNVYLTLIGVPSFVVNDPLNMNSTLLTDTPYADVNDDGYSDLSVGRLVGTLDSLSFQVEYADIFAPEKKALILASYNTEGRYLDVLLARGTMPYLFNIEMSLMLKDFETTRLVEKKTEFDRINITILEELRNIAETLGALSSKTYTSFFSQLLGDASRIYLIAKAGGMILYSVYEFDWSDAWKRILTLELPDTIEHLPVLNEENLIKYLPGNIVVTYLSKGNETHWFLPVNHTFWSTSYTVFDPAKLPFNPALYYLRYSGSFSTSSKLLDNGALSLVCLTGESYVPYSDHTADVFFNNINKPVGNALKLAKNRNLELSEYSVDSTIKAIYKKEHYTTNLIGDPSLILDPGIEHEDSYEAQGEGTFTLNFLLEPSYSLISYGDSNLIVFYDADEQLLANNKPIVPLYSESFILPSHSEVLDVSLSSVEKVYENISFPILFPDPNFFKNESFTGSFPENIYMNKTISLMDNRRVFDMIFSPVIYSSDGKAKIFDRINVSITYSAPLEIKAIHAEDVFQGETARITFGVYNGVGRMPVNTSMIIHTTDSDYTLEKTFVLSEGINTLEIDFKNTSNVGHYSVALALRYDDGVVGPKYTSFNVKKTPIKFEHLYPMLKRVFTGITDLFLKLTNFIESYNLRIHSGAATLDYKTWNMSLHIEQKDDVTRSVLKTRDGILLIEQRPGKLMYRLESPEGKLVIVKEAGRMNETSEGDSKKLRLLLEEMIATYREGLVHLNLTTS